MSKAYSISTHRRFGLSRVCLVWGVSRATVYRQRYAQKLVTALVRRRFEVA